MCLGYLVSLEVLNYGPYSVICECYVPVLVIKPFLLLMHFLRK